MAGAVGGAIALAATSATSMIVTYFLARRVGLIVPWNAIGRIVVAAVAMSAVVLSTPSARNIVELIVRIGLGGVSFVLVLSALYSRTIFAKLKLRKRSRVTALE
jgi:peptidoglycan biosynthesis protein MviN/MurJ (putative lipid II flippase)